MAVHPKQDHLAVGQEIFEALQAAFPKDSGVFILHWADPRTDKLPAQFTPAVIVAYGYDAPLDGRDQQLGRGVKLMCDQEWRVAVVVKDAASQSAGTASLDEAGPIIAKVIKTLAGRPGGQRNLNFAMAGFVGPVLRQQFTRPALYFHGALSFIGANKKHG